MSASPLILGTIAFQDFEIPSHIRVGGAQRLAVHRLPGGARVIDALGPDDGLLTWTGTLAGAGASERARLLDVLRRSGLVLPLTWDGWSYAVIVSKFQADTARPWWIPYKIACTVLQDDAAVVAEIAVAISATADLATAATYVPDAGRGQIDARMDAASPGLTSSDPGAQLASAQNLAQLSAARGFAARAGVTP